MIKRLTYFSLFIILLYLLPFPWTNALRNSTVRVLAPIGHLLVRQNVAFGNFAHSITQISELRQEKASLQQQVIHLGQELANQETTRRENEALRKELGVTGVVRESKKALAHIVLAGSDPFDRTFTVDIGSNEGVQEGQPAVYQGALVGKVIGTKSGSAVIRSILSPKSKIQTWIVDSREKGLLVGDGGAAHLTDITQGVPIKENSLLETSGLGNSLPQGILIGQIQAVESKKSDLSQTFSVKLAQDPNSLESVFILLVDSK